ncbi:UvrD-helicase domain-containing protein [Mycetocola sp. 2940]|uniref:nuclease-related domain-containing DEAD/DEAH box helicase n=1 Tax=Mycetocola sp. 2940 TaxID=3156452 RepID=UPI003394E28E
MSAGSSAGQESLRQFALAAQHERAARDAREAAGRYRAASVSEKQVARVLAPLSAAGYHFLPDRQWPGSRTAQVDLVMVGPGGVFIVDTKWWKDVVIAAGRVFRDQDDVTDEFDNLADLAFGTEGALGAVGLAPGEVRPIVVLAGRKGVKASIGTVDIVGEGDVLRHIASRGSRLTAVQVDTVLRAALSHFPVLGAAQPVNTMLPEPVIEAPSATIDESDLLSTDEVNSALLGGMLAAPVEEWMTFLHPDQSKLIRRNFNGPSRIRGAAGTGKTVIGLHRAAYLARSRPGKVLVTTYVRTLPTVLSSLMERMAPEVSDKVEFVSVHRFAHRVLSERGIRVNTNPTQANSAFKSAWFEVGAKGPLAAIEAKDRYWKEEIDHVIKGRGMTSFEDYANSARIGRRRRLSIDQRRDVWALYRSYEDRLRKAGINDFADQILLAAQSLRNDPLTEYSAVIVDEAQDLSCAMVGMLHSLVGDGADGFTLIGDGQQSIYPGGYTLAEVGISLAGRGVVMDTNYRNTAEVVAFANAMIAGDQFTDIEGTDQRADATKLVPRHGSAPVVVTCETVADHDFAMVNRIRAVASEVGTSFGDIGILGLTNATVDLVERACRAAGIPTVDLEKYDGRTIDAVKIGTVKRAKGLEFKQVLVPRLRTSQLYSNVRGPQPAEAAAIAINDIVRERDERDRRELYVAMTRARDGLWVGVIG